MKSMRRHVLTFTLVAASTLLGGATLAASAADYIQDAKTYLQTGERSKAVIELKNALQEEPNNGEARLLLGKTYLTLGQPAEAEKELRHARAAGVDRKRYLPELGEAYLAQGKGQEVLDELKPVESDPPELAARIHTLRARALLGQKNRREDARAELQKAEALDPRQSDLELAWAGLAVRDKDENAALSHVEKALAIDPNNARAWVLKGDLLRRKGETEGALEAFEKATKADPNLPTGWLGKAAVELALGKPDAAEKTLETLDRYRPNLLYRQYLGAIIAFQRKQYDKVQNLMVPIMRAQPGYLQSEFILGMTDFLQGHYERANFNLENFLKTHPQHVGARKLAAVVDLKLGNPKQAIERLEPMQGTLAKDAQLFSLLGAAYLQAGDANKANEFLQRATELAPDAENIKTQLALGHLAAGDTAGGVSILEHVAAGDTNVGVAGLVLARVYLRDKEYDKALEAGREMAKKQPDNPFPDNLIGLAWLGKGDREKARQAFEQALRIKPDFVPARLNLANLDMAADKFDEARQHLMEVLKVSPKDEGAMLRLARLAEKQGKADEALTWVQKAFETSPGAVRSGVMLANYYLRKGEPLKALPVARTMVDNNPDNPAALEMLALAQIATKDLRSAIANYEKLVRLKPNAAAYARLGQLYLQQKDFDAARKAYAKSLELSPQNLSAMVGMAVLELTSGDLGKASERVTALRKAHPDAAVSYQLEGDILRNQKRFKEAASAYAEAYGRAPSPPLGLLVYQMRKQAGDATALKWLEQGIQKFPDSAELHMILAGEHLAAGRFAEATGEYEKVLALNPDNPVVLNNLAWLYQQQGDLKRALELGAKAKALAPKKPEILDTYGWIALHAGREKEGLEAIRQAATLAPHLGSLQYHLAVAQDKNGERDSARKTLERLLKSDKQFPELAEAQALFERLKSGG